MKPIFQATLWMGGTIASFSLMAVAGRAVSLAHDTFEIMLFRSLVGILIVLVVGRFSGTLPQIKRRNLGLHLSRNLAHFAGQNLWFYALPLLPLAQLFAVEFTSPIWVLLLSPLILGERLTPMRLLAGAFGLAGVLIVTRPDLSQFDPALFAAALSAIGFAFSMMLTKRLTRHESITCILFYLTVMQAVFGLICAGYDGDITLPDAAALPWLVAIGIAGVNAHFCLTKALSLAPATTVVPMDFVRLPVIIIIGAVFYNEPFEMWVLLGAALIFGGNYLNIWEENRNNRVALAPSEPSS